MTYFLIIAGFALLLFGGESVVRGSVALAQRLGISPLIVGLTIVGFGTSLPEMVVSVNAALVGSPGLAVGNVVGSNIANILLILGVAAIIAPIAVSPGAVKRDLLGMSAVTLVYVGLGMSGQIVFWQGALMLIALMSYIGFTVWHDNKSNDEVAELHREEAAEMGTIPLRTVSIAGIIIVGLFAVVVGAEWLVTGATTLATEFGCRSLRHPSLPPIADIRMSASATCWAATCSIFSASRASPPCSHHCRSQTRSSTSICGSCWPQRR
jgi:cation:H+ antiporter